MNIVTQNVYPIPHRSVFWCAFFAGHEKDGPFGWGATEDEAIRNLDKKLSIFEYYMTAMDVDPSVARDHEGNRFKFNPAPHSTARRFTYLCNEKHCECHEGEPAYEAYRRQLWALT